ncbi:MAG: hypothetical protein GXO00_01860 [Candidatus Diapherotrites archaeon]|nr:hypothetical protein [Candidatus Diapherotrites archaeon]
MGSITLVLDLPETDRLSEDQLQRLARKIVQHYLLVELHSTDDIVDELAAEVRKSLRKRVLRR